MTQIIDCGYIDEYDEEIKRKVKDILKNNRSRSRIPLRDLGVIIDSDYDLGRSNYCIFHYDEKNKQISIIFCNLDYIVKMIESIRLNFSKKFTIIFPLSIYDPEFGRKTVTLFNRGFKLPEESIITAKKDEFILNTYLPLTHLRSCSSYTNYPKAKANIAKVQSILENLENMIEFGYCSKTLIFEKKTLDYLRNMCQKSKEYSGCFSINNDNKLEINKKTIKTGNVDSVDSSCCMYSYHTHPKKAYKKYNVSYAWPSIDDYRAFLELAKYHKAVFHTVATIEGIYLLYINKTIDVKNITTKQYLSLIDKIGDNYDIYDKNQDCSSTTCKLSPTRKILPVDYIKNINRVKIRNPTTRCNFVLFNVSYYEWINLENVHIPIEYPSIDCS